VKVCGSKCSYMKMCGTNCNYVKVCEPKCKRKAIFVISMKFKGPNVI
jgi:hypothetical protein